MHGFQKFASLFLKRRGHLKNGRRAPWTPVSYWSASSGDTLAKGDPELELDMIVRPARARLALIAHDEKKDALVEFAKRHLPALQQFDIVATGTTGTRLLKACPALSVTPMRSGPLGGDQQIGAMIAEGKVQGLIFFIDPLTPMPHDVDVKALMRLAVVYDVATALNEATAELLIADPSRLTSPSKPAQESVS